MDDRRRTAGSPPAATTRTSRDARRRALETLVAEQPIASQRELVALLAARGFAVDGATVSRDVAALGIAKVMRDGRRTYALPGELGPAGRGGDASLRRLLDDLPVTVRRSGLTLLLITLPGMASALAQAIDQSATQEQEGTLAGDNTVLVLFADEASMARWRARFDGLRGDGDRVRGGDR